MQSCRTFCLKYNNSLKELSFQIQGFLDRLKFSISIFSLDKIKLSFKDDGLLNLQINGFNPELSGRGSTKNSLIKVSIIFTVSLRNFRFDGDLKITTKYENGVLVPDIYFEGNPSLSFTFKYDLGNYMLHRTFSSIINNIADFAKDLVMPTIKKLLKKILGDIVLGFPKEININNYKLDVTLSSSGIKLRNKFL